jgi:type IV secretory pathway VirB3-like protein
MDDGVRMDVWAGVACPYETDNLLWKVVYSLMWHVARIIVLNDDVVHSIASLDLSLN